MQLNKDGEDPRSIQSIDIQESENNQSYSARTYAHTRSVNEAMMLYPSLSKKLSQKMEWI